MYIINEDDFNLILKIAKLRNKELYEKLIKIENTELQTKRTLNKKSLIESCILELLENNHEVTKYKVHKATEIAYQTINKYYDVILQDCMKQLNDKRTLF